MKQMPFPDTNYGKQNKQKQTLKPIIIRPLMQTRWREAGAYQLLEVITKLQTIFHPPGLFSISVSGMFGLTSNILVHTSDSSVDGLINKKKKRNHIHACSELSSLLWSMTFLSAPSLACIPLYPLGLWVPGLYLPHAACGWFLPGTGACR